MPYKSEAQRRFLHMKHPNIAKRWDKKYGKPKKLPYHVKKRRRAPQYKGKK
jgi:hypothetical protein